MDDFPSESQAYLILNALPGIGPITLNRLLENFGGDIRAVFQASASELLAVRGVGNSLAQSILHWEEYFNPEQEEKRMLKAAVDFIPQNSPLYPAPLKQISDPPIGLYRKGKYDFTQPAIAIVGSRRTTLYGLATARKLAMELAQMGFCIVSGLARGIDSAAHQGAIEGGGNTLAVLGTGIDIIYPPENLELYRRVEEHGAILSEFPFGRRADTQSFAMRNRIISGLCEAVVVVESALKGGSMITARFAGEQGRQLFAVPGRIDQASSAGCHQLIRDGATLLTCSKDLIAELNYIGIPTPSPQKSAVSKSKPRAASVQPLDEEEARIFEYFKEGSILSADQIGSLSGLPPQKISAILMMLEIKGLLAKRLDGSFEAR